MSTTSTGANDEIGIGSDLNTGASTYRVVKETRLSWIVRPVNDSGNLAPYTHADLKVDKATLVQRGARKDYRPKRFMTQEAYETGRRCRALEATIHQATRGYGNLKYTFAQLEAAAQALGLE